MSTLIEKQRFRRRLQQLSSLCERNFRAIKSWRWLEDHNSIRLHSEAVADLPTGVVEITVLHRWAYTTVLRLQAAANFSLTVRLYHDAQTAEVTEVQTIASEKTLLLGANGSHEEKIYWNAFLAHWIEQMSPSLRMVSSL